MTAEEILFLMKSKEKQTTTGVSDRNMGTILRLGGRSPTDHDGKLGFKIKELRRKRGLTQKQVAHHIGVTGAQFHRYEAGVTRIAASRLISIAAVLGVAPQAILQGDVVYATNWAMPSITEGGDLVELVELFTECADPKRRAAILAITRSITSKAKEPGGSAQ